MNFYLDTNFNKLLDISQSYSQAQPTVLFLNDTVEMYWQLLTATGISSRPYTYVTFPINCTMSVGLGYPSPTTTASVVSSTTMSYDSSSYFWYGSLKLSGSLMQDLMLAGSSSYLELQENTPLYTLTRYQETVSVLPDLNKS